MRSSKRATRIVARTSLEELGLGHGLLETELYAGLVELLAGDPTGPGFAALAFFLPIDLAVLALLPERPVARPQTLILVAVVVVQSWFVAAVPMAILAYVATPAVASQFDLEYGLARWFMVIVGLFWLFGHGSSGLIRQKLVLNPSWSCDNFMF